MKDGFIQMPRAIQDSWIWNDGTPFDTRSAWEYIVMNAYWADCEKDTMFGKQVYKRGQYPTSTRKLSESWGWSQSKVNRFIKRLENEGMLVHEKIKSGSLLTIVNYGIYQGERITNESPTEEETNHERINNRKGNESQMNQERFTNESGTVREKLTIKEDKENNNINNIQEDEEKKESKKKSEEDIHRAERERIINYFNLRCNTNYRPNSKDTKEKVNARLAEGFTEEDFYLVIDKKADEWTGTEYEKYLTPETLFRPSKFEKYLNQNIVKANQTVTKAQQKLEESRDMMRRWAEQED